MSMMRLLIVGKYKAYNDVSPFVREQADCCFLRYLLKQSF